MEETRIMEYEVLAMRMCPFCDNMYERVFSVATARAKINSVLNIDDPDAFKAAMPWHTTPPTDMSNADIEAAGMSLPPFHGPTIMASSSNIKLSGSVNDEDERAAIIANVEDIRTKKAAFEREYDFLEIDMNRAISNGDVKAYENVINRMNELE